MPSYGETLYTVTPVPAAPVYSIGASINGSGQVTGTVGIGQSDFAFLYSNGALTLLSQPGIASQGYGINDLSEVVGFSGPHAVLYNNAGAVDLGTLPGDRRDLLEIAEDSNSIALAINDSSQITGEAQSSGSGVHAFLYSNGVMTDLGTLPGGSNSMGYGINASGQITGQSGIAGGASHAFLYSNGAMTDLDTLPGGSNSVGYGINNSGQITGQSGVAGGSSHAFVYASGIMTDLGTLPGGSISVGYGINNSGEIVGESIGPGGASHAFISSNGVLTDLNSLVDPALGITLGDAVGVNDSGQIIANGTGAGVFGRRAYLLTPVSAEVPEPWTFAAAGAGLCILAAIRLPARTARA